MSTTTIADKYARSDDFAARLEGLFLPDEAWAVFAELEHPASGEQIAGRLQQPPEAVLDAINLLLEQKLIRKHLVSWRDFLAKGGNRASTPANPVAPVTAPVAAAMTAGRPGAPLAGWPKPTAPAVVPETPAPPAPTIAPAVEVTTAAPAPATPAAPEPPAPPVAQAQPLPAAEPPPVLFSDFGVAPPPARIVDRAPAVSESPLATVAPAPRAPVIPAVVAPSPAHAAPAPGGAGSIAPAAVAPVPGSATPVTPVAAPCATPSPKSAPAAPSKAETVLPVSFSVSNEKARLERRAAEAMTISFRIAAVINRGTQTSWKLHPLLKAIEQKGGGGLPGQLLVYRVFIHVPAEMMHAAGIQSLSLVDENVMIHDRAFYDALCQAAHAVASLDLRTVKA